MERLYGSLGKLGMFAAEKPGEQEHGSGPERNELHNRSAKMKYK